MAVKTQYVIAVAIVIAIGAGAAIFLQRSRQPAQIPVVVTHPAAPSAAPQAPPDCLLPGPPPVAPDGNTATAADMKLGHDVLQGFVVQLEAYQACRNNQADHAAPGVSDQQKQAWIEKGNEAVDEANAIASSFSDQLKIFKARTASKK
jgi:hypothetical protein